MSVCGTLQHIFENPLPENPTLLESLSWNQLKPIKPIEQSSSFSEIFGELHFKESPHSSPSSPSSSHHVSTSSLTEPDHTNLSQNEVSAGSSDIINQTPSSLSYVSSIPAANVANSHKSSDSFSSLSSESLQLCTEGLGFESSDDVEDLKTRRNNECLQTQSEKEAVKKSLASEYSYVECRRSRASGREYPPPISCIGKTGKPCVCFRSYRTHGRFILKEIRIPTKEFLHAHREDGRLKLHFVQPDDEFLEETSEEEEEEEEEQEEDDDDDVEIIDGGEENMGKENDDCVTDQVNEEKEIDA